MAEVIGDVSCEVLVEELREDLDSFVGCYDTAGS